MQDIFLSETVESSSITVETIRHLVEMELKKIIFPDGIIEAIRSECEKIIPSFLENVFLSAGARPAFLIEFNLVLMDNRLHQYRAAIIAWVWLGVVRSLARIKIVPDPALNELYGQMMTIAADYGRMI